MMKASNMERTVPVYINFQLTERRAALAKSVRQAKSDSKVAGYSVDQNGKIKIKKNGGARQRSWMFLLSRGEMALTGTCQLITTEVGEGIHNHIPKQGGGAAYSVIERRDGSDKNMPANNHRGGCLCMYKKSHLRKVQL